MPAFDDGVHNTRHLGGDGCQRFAPQIGIVAIFGDVALELVAEAIVALTNGDLTGDPEGFAQARIAELRELCLPTELAGLMRGEIKSAELQELAMRIASSKMLPKIVRR